jgi:hypothetical protein
MFAHQVIEDLKTFKIMMEKVPLNTLDPAPKYALGIAKYSLNYIDIAQKFHIEDLESIESALQTWNKTLDATLVKFPYNKMWIDFAYKDKKIGILVLNGIVENLGFGTYMYVFIYRKTASLSLWVPEPLGIELQEGQTRPIIYDQYQEEYIDGGAFGSLIGGIAYALALLLNCKNIQLEKIPAPEALNKKRRKAGKQELFDYHVLNVVVPSKKRGYHETTIPLSHNRVHLCRGHFKEYTAEHPLFGLYTGLYWWQPHVRGQNKEGIVMKEYNILQKTA